jgi:hypothetical protein
MGGQACVFYGGAEFSRDTDLALLADDPNWRQFRAALAELQAEPIAVPPDELAYLRRGFAVHFRCHHPEAEAMRIDIMSVMRGVDDFPRLWERRAEIAGEDGTVYSLLSLPDLVLAKKTQRSKDWPMIQRLIEADFARNRRTATDGQIRFWLREMRSPALLAKLAEEQSALAREIAAERPSLTLALANRVEELRTALGDEERQERERDRIYWQPLKLELERLRHPH